MESLKRLGDVLWAPTGTFAKIAERPTWAVALLVLLGLNGALGVAAVQRIDSGAQRELFRESFEERGLRGEELERQVDRAAEVSARFAPVAPIFGVAAGALGYLSVALLFLVGFRVGAGGELRFAQSFSVTLHGLMPHALAALLSLPVVLSRQSLDPESLRRGSFLASSPASLAPDGTSPAVLALLGSADLFTIWAVILLVLGYRTVARVSTGTSSAVVGAAWLLWIAVRVGLAVLFS